MTPVRGTTPVDSTPFIRRSHRPCGATTPLLPLRRRARFLSRGASPVVYHNQIVGAVYAYEYDTVQAELLRSFQTNIMRISLLVALFVLFLSALLSRMFTRRISDLLQAIRQVREGLTVTGPR